MILFWGFYYTLDDGRKITKQVNANFKVDEVPIFGDVISLTSTIKQLVISFGSFANKNLPWKNIWNGSSCVVPLLPDNYEIVKGKGVVEYEMLSDYNDLSWVEFEYTYTPDTSVKGEHEVIISYDFPKPFDKQSKKYCIKTYVE